MEIILKIIKAGLLTFFIYFLFSCKKDEGVGTVDIAKVNVINAVVDGGNVKVNVGTRTIPWVNINDNQILGGSNTLSRLYIAPTASSTYLQVVQASDTTKFWYNQQKQLDANKMYTLYLSGTPANVKTSFQEETNFPKYILRDASRPTPVTDSIVNIRFVNLSPSGPKVDINIRGNTVNEVSALSYEAFTDFKAYPTPSNVSSIVFEIRNSTNKELLATFSQAITSVRFKSIAILMFGIYPGTTQASIDKYRVASVIYQ